MYDCDCDDGIGMYVCRKHSTPQNDIFHNLFHKQTEVYEKQYIEIEDPVEDDE